MHLKSLILRIVPGAAVSSIRHLRWASADRREAAAVVGGWEELVTRHPSFASIKPGDSALIVPADQETIFGSRGEDAMVTAMTAAFRRHVSIVDIVANGDVAILEAQRRGYRTHRLTGTREFAKNVGRLLETTQPRAVAIIGADVIDGHYGASLAVRLLITADIAARHGIAATVTGFSLNTSPSPYVLGVLNRIHPSVALNLRDPASLERFRQKTHATPILVADCAFMLVPDCSSPVVDEVTTWVTRRHAAGRIVLAFNCHPLFAGVVTDAEIRRLVAASARALGRVSSERAVSWLLLPHDYRGRIGDAIVLRPVFDALRESLGDDIYYLEGVHTAATLKAVAATMDGVATGRMHLAIGALGSGVPTAGLTYQHKFEGLYSLLGLPQKLLMPIDKILQGDALYMLLHGFVDELDATRHLVGNALPRIMEMSATNLAKLTPALVD